MDALMMGGSGDEVKSRRESESRRITRTHNEWLAKRGLPVGNRFNRWEKAKSNEN